MPKKYNDKFIPNSFFRTSDKNSICNPFYMEVSDLCYLHQGIKRKDDILIYSSLSSGFNDSEYDITDYSNDKIGKLLNIKQSEVEKSIDRLANLGLIKISKFSNGARNIKIDKDLRRLNLASPLNGSDKCSTKIYYRMFFYPEITKTMVHIYAYYWKLSRLRGYLGFSGINYNEVSDALGYSVKTISNTLEQMENIGLIKIDKRLNAVILKIDFEHGQADEVSYNKELEYWHSCFCGEIF